MKGIQIWSRKYTSTQGDPRNDCFRYNRDPDDNIEKDLRAECLAAGGFLWNDPETLYQISIEDNFKQTRNFLSGPILPRKEEPYKKTITIESMPPKYKQLPGGLRVILENKGFTMDLKKRG